MQFGQFLLGRGEGGDRCQRGLPLVPPSLELQLLPPDRRRGQLHVLGHRDLGPDVLGRPLPQDPLRDGLLLALRRHRGRVAPAGGGGGADARSLAVAAAPIGGHGARGAARSARSINEYQSIPWVLIASILWHNLETSTA